MMRIRHESCSDFTVITLIGQFVRPDDIAELGVFIQKQIDDKTKNIIINMGGVDFINSAAIGFLVKTQTELNKIYGKLVLCNAKKLVLESLTVMKIDSVIKIFSSQQEAVEHILS